MKRLKIVILLFLSGIAGVSCFHESTSDRAPSWDSEIPLSKAVDVNPDETIVEINLEAIETDIELVPGSRTRMWTYNGLFPGPTIEAKVGDTLIVNFVNRLPVETTIHWHGVELPATMDGSMIAQLAVQPNESFRYSFKLLRAATYWYHPHIQSSVQVEKGLYGALVVREPELENQLALPKTEATLILDDILLDDANQVALTTDQAVPFDALKHAETLLNGREGNVFLINGKALKLDSTSKINTVKVHSGTPLRFRLINAANARFFRLSIPGHTLYRIGGDAGLLPSPFAAEPVNVLSPIITQGINARTVKPRDGEPLQLYSDPDTRKGIMVVPGERADVVFTPIGNAGEILDLEWHFYPRGYHSTERGVNNEIMITHNHKNALTLPIKILRFEFDKTSTANAQIYTPPLSLKPVDTVYADINTPLLPITFGHSMPDVNGAIDFFATTDTFGNGITFNNVTDQTALYARIGQTYIWEITNLTQGDHPFHPHGFVFQHIDTRYIDLDFPDDAQKNRLEYPLTPGEIKDTIRIPGRPGVRGRSKTVVRLAVRFDETGRESQVEAYGKFPTYQQSGGWFVHCHILEHAAYGMGTYLNLTY